MLKKMRTGRPKEKLPLTEEQRRELEQRTRRPTSTRRTALRAAIVLECAAGFSNQSVASRHGVTELTVGKWRRRFLSQGLVGLDDAPRPGRPRQKLLKKVLKRGGAGLEARLIKRIKISKKTDESDIKTAGQPNGGRRVSLQDIAKALGVHFSTVSRALRRDPRLSEELCQKVQTTAQKMGYEPDPHARVMAAYRTAIRPATQRGTLALLASTEFSNDFASVRLLEIARQQAAQMGYQIDLIAAQGPGVTSKRLTRILRARGIAGLLILPPPDSRSVPRRLRLDWSHFPAVMLGHGLFWPHLHRVGEDHFGNAQLLVRKLISLGYRRIGFCVDPRVAALRAGGGWEGGYYVEMKRLGAIPSSFYCQSHVLDVHQVEQWVQREHLDAIIADSFFLAGQITQFFQSRVPERLGVACLATYGSEFSGINTRSGHIWEAAVDFLVHLINTNQRGIPAVAQRILIEGFWDEGGRTVRRIVNGKTG